MAEMNNISMWLGVLTVIAFAVNIIVQLTKEIIPPANKAVGDTCVGNGYIGTAFCGSVL